MSLLRHHQLLMSKGRGGYDAEILADNPTAYWPLDELSGTSITDASGNGHTGTLVSATINQSPIVTDGGRAYSMTGSPAYLNFGPNYGAFESFAIEGWFNFGSVSNERHLFTKWGVTTGDQLTLFSWLTSTAKINFQLQTFGAGGGVKSLTSIASVTTGVDYHIVLRFDKPTQTMGIYINGVLDNSAVVSGSLRVGTTKEYLSVAAKIVNNVPTDMTSGRYGIYNVDNIAFYTYASTATPALSAARILAHYNAGI